MGRRLGEREAQTVTGDENARPIGGASASGLSNGPGLRYPRAWSSLRSGHPVLLPAAEAIPLATEQPWPRVTLVMPSLNQAGFLEEAILSVLGQRYPDLEYLLIDGGSSDGSLEIIREYADRITYWESAPDRGQASAINKGWRRATGRYVWWLNSDDLLTPGSLATTVRALEDNPTTDMVYGDVIRIDERDDCLGLYRYRDFDPVLTITLGHDIAQAGALLRKEVLDRIGLLDEELHYLMDKDMWTRLALAGGSIQHLATPLAIFRIHEEAKTQAGDPVAVAERYRYTSRLLGDARLPEAIRRQSASIRGRMHLACARVHMKGGRYGAALEEARRAIQVEPSELVNPAMWWTIFLSGLGLIIGERRWRRVRSWFRQKRRRTV